MNEACNPQCTSFIASTFSAESLATNPIQSNPTQSNSWMHPTHIHVCYGYTLAHVTEYCPVYYTTKWAICRKHYWDVHTNSPQTVKMLSLRLLSGINQWKPNTACRYNAHENSAAHVQSLKGAECSARGNNEHSSQPAQEPRNLNASKIALSNWISTYKIRF